MAASVIPATVCCPKMSSTQSIACLMLKATTIPQVQVFGLIS
jgi:hypothetical protein